MLAAGTSIAPKREKCQVNKPERWPTPEDVDEKGTKMYIIERILMSFSVKTMQNPKKTKALVKWTGYSFEESSWEDVSPAICDLCIDTYVCRSQKMTDIRRKLAYTVTPFFPYNRRTCEFALQVMTLAQSEDYMNSHRNYQFMADILVENWFDHEVPEEFIYISQNTISEAAEAMFNKDMMCGIECHECFESGFCVESNCCAGSMKLPFPYMAEGEVLNPALRNQVIIECGEDCPCYLNCPSRVVQRGRKFTLIVFREPKQQWTLRTGALIHEGSFVLQYIGEVLTIDEATERRAASPRLQYRMHTTTSKGFAFVIDSTEQSNECRFLRHSCNPNLECRGVYASRNDQSYQELAFFATRRIEMGEELTVDFYAHVDTHPEEISEDRCKCGSTNCRVFLSSYRSPPINPATVLRPIETIDLNDSRSDAPPIPDDKALVRKQVQEQLQRRRREFADEEWSFDSEGNTLQRFRSSKTQRAGMRESDSSVSSSSSTTSSASSASSFIYTGLRVRPRRARKGARKGPPRQPPTNINTRARMAMRMGMRAPLQIRTPSNDSDDSAETVGSKSASSSSSTRSTRNRNV